MADNWDEFYQGASDQYQVDPKLLRAVVSAESNADPAAVSSAGAVGPAQLLPETAKNLGIIDPTNPQQAIYGAAKLLDQNLRAYGNDPNKAVLAYHGGTDQKNWGPKTQAYLQRVSAAYNGGATGNPAPAPDLLDAFSGKATTPAAVAASAPASTAPEEDLLTKFSGGTPPELPGAPPAVVASGDTSGLPWYGKAGVGIVQGAADIGHTVGNLLDVPAQYLENQFGTLGGPSVAAASAARNSENKLYQQQFGDSTAATLGRIAGTTALTAPVLGAGAAALDTAPVIGNALTAARTSGLLGRVGANALVGGAQGLGAAAATSSASDQPLAKDLEQGGVLGAILGGAAPLVQGVGSGAARLLGGGGAVNPLRADLARTAIDQYGIPLRGSQITDSPSVKFLDSVLTRTPFSGMGDRGGEQASAFTRAVSNSFGEDAENLTPGVIQAAKSRIGQVFDHVASNTTIRADNQFLNDLSSVESEARTVLPAGEVTPLQNQIDAILSKTQGNGTISGETYQALTRKGAPLDRAMESDNPNIAHYAGQLRDALDSALQRSAPPAMQDALTQAKYQWKNLRTIQPIVAKAGAASQVSPALLMGRVTSVYGPDAVSTGRAGDLGDLAKIGQTFLKEAPSSGTSERLGAMALLGEAGGLIANPHLALPVLGSTAATVGAARAASSALNSNWYRNMLLNSGQAGLGANLGATVNPSMLNQLLRRSAIPAAVGFQQSLSPQPALSGNLLINPGQ